MKNRPASVLRPVLFAMLVLRLFGCAEPRGKVRTGVPTPTPPQDARGSTAVLPPAAPEPPTPPMPITRVVEEGDGWRRIKVAGEAADETGQVRPLQDEYWVLEGRAGLDRSPIPPLSRKIIAAGLGAAPAGTEADGELLVVSTTVVASIEAGTAGVAGNVGCEDEERTFNKSYDVDRGYNLHRESGGAFSGTADIDSRINGKVSGHVSYAIRHAACLPFLVIRKVSVSARLDVISGAAIDGRFADNWEWNQEVYAPVLGTVTLPGTNVPVIFKAPITVGIDSDAAAELHVKAQFEAHGTFDVACSAAGCTGSRSATHGFLPKGAPVAVAAGQARVVPWVEGGVRVDVVDAASIRTQVGVRARLGADLWSYAGTTCGDADHNGSNETVSSATVDLGIGIDVVARMTRVGREEAPWFWNVSKRHLAFWSLGGTGALDPIFYPEESETGALTMRAAMRPCWPHTDPVTYLVTWSDGATELVTGAPNTLLTLRHTFPLGTDSPRVLRLDALTDSAGRTLGGSTTRSVSTPTAVQGLARR